MAPGKRRQGVALADDVAALGGLPPGITYDEWVQLVLNSERVRCHQIRTLFQALQMAAGKNGPIGYYELFTDGNRDRASNLLGLDKLAGMMACRRR